MLSCIVVFGQAISATAEYTTLEDCKHSYRICRHQSRMIIGGRDCRGQFNRCFRSLPEDQQELFRQEEEESKRIWQEQRNKELKEEQRERQRELRGGVRQNEDGVWTN